MEKFLENIMAAERTLQTADHMIYVTFPLMRDKRLLLKVLQETKNAIAQCISSILQYDYLYKRITLYKDSKSNFKIFRERCAPRYKISKDEINLIIELFDLIEKHKESPFEFVKDEKIVILSNDLKPKTLTLEKTKEFLILGKNILRKIQDVMRKNFKEI